MPYMRYSRKVGAEERGVDTAVFASHQISDWLSQLFCAVRGKDKELQLLKEISSDFKVPGLKSNKKNIIKYTVEIVKTVLYSQCYI